MIGLSGLFEAYKTALKGTSLSGPTYFNGILKALIAFIQQNISLTMYHTLLILTDGAIHDMKETRDLIVEASHLPLSIIIVGIGNADFSNMVELDGDEVRLRNSMGQPAVRDIVQFVEFKGYKTSTDLGLLAEEVLKEVPEQIVGYMVMKGIKPEPVAFMS